MVFPSLEFALFAVLFFGCWPWARIRQNVRWMFLTGMSFWFYGWWDWRFLPLLIASGLVDFLGALAIVRWPCSRRWWLVASLTANLGILGLFKYADFVCENFEIVLNSFGISPPWRGASLHWTLPLGISFYTFQSMSYTIDVYRGRLQPTRNLWHFFSYLALFPQLVAGPIVRGSDLLPQLCHASVPSEEERWTGTWLIVRGFFKKMVLADSFAPVVNAAFDETVVGTSAAYWWVIAAMFASQIYCDFSGYSDIACGLAKWMGYSFPQNFRSPYQAVGLRDFWCRWHISLSEWFRDYVYIPLGGSRCGPWREHLNLWIVLLLSSLWHGAAWHFVAWGVFHACLLSFERLTDWPRRCERLPGGRLLAWAVTFALVLSTWVVFRATSVAQAVDILTTMFAPEPLQFWGGIANLRRLPLLQLACFLVWQSCARGAVPVRIPNWPVVDRWLGPAFVGGLAAATIFLRGPGNAFIYFQF